MKDALILTIGLIIIISLCVGACFLDAKMEQDEFNNGLCRNCGADVIPVQSANHYGSEDNDWYCPECHHWN